MKRLSRITMLLFIAAALIPAGCSQQTAANIRLQDTAINIQRALQGKLDALDSDLEAAAQKLSTTGLTGPEAEAILLGLCKNRPYIVDCSTVNASGKLAAIMPEEFKRFEGSDISTQDHIIKLFQAKHPVFSHVFKAVEGFTAVDLERPVFSDKGAMIGSVSALIKVEVIFDKLARPKLAGTEADKVWAMQKDGLLIFDYDTGEINTNLFTDPLYQSYPDLISLGKQISNRECGCGSYQYLNFGKPVKRQACWSSVSLHGTQWRIIVTQVVSK